MKCVVCGTECSKQCVRCKRVYYCSSTCQNKDWNVHKRTCKAPIAFQISQVQERGRILIASKRFEPGDIVLSEYPIITFSSEHNSDELNKKINLQAVCDEINAQLDTYISKEENLPDISIDPKLLDIALQFVKESILVKNNVLNLYKPPDDDITRSAYNWFRIGVMLLAERCKEYLPLSEKIDQNLFTDVILIAYVNAFKSANVNSGALYALSCLINHSCHPNCFYVQDKEDGNRITVRAIRRIEIGEEINISYISDHVLIMPTSIRQTRLSTYHFICKCERCSKPDDTRIFHCDHCLSDTPLIRECSNCKNEINVQERLQFEQKAKEKVYVLKCDFGNLFDDTELISALHFCEVRMKKHWCVNELHEMLHDFYTKHFRSRTLSIQEFSKDEMSKLYEKMITHMNQRILYSEYILGTNYTVARLYETLGDNYAILSTFCNNDHKEDNRTLALKAYKKSQDILKILLGSKHIDIESVRIKIQDLELGPQNKL